MLETTKNYGLLKPTSDEFYDVGIQNGNMDQVDQVLTELENSKAKQTDVDASIERLDQKMIAKADRENPVFTGKVIVPELSADPSDNEAATVKFVRENGGGAAAGVSITEKTQETTGAGEPNVESALGSVGTRLSGLETAAPSPTESGTILYSTEEGVRRNIPFLIGEPKGITGLAVEKQDGGWPTDLIAYIDFSHGIVPAVGDFELTSSGDGISVTDGYWGNGVRIDGTTNDYIIASTSVISIGSPFTARLKCKTTSNVANAYICGTSWADAQKGSYLAIHSGRILYNCNNSGAFSEIEGPKINDNKWHDIIASYSASTSGNGMVLWVDGEKVGEKAIPTPPPSFTRNFCIGNAPVSINKSVDCIIDEIEVYESIKTPLDFWKDQHGKWYKTQMPPSGTHLTWTNPADLLIPQTVHIRRSSEAYPATLEEGVEVYSGSDESYLDETADLSMDQYYTAWVDNSMVTKTDESMKVKYEAAKGYLMLYDHGDECVDVTGGWSMTFTQTPGANSLTKRSDCMEISGKTSTAVASTANKIFVSGYSILGGLLSCTASSDPRSGIGIGNDTGRTFTTKTDKNYNYTKEMLEMLLTNVSGTEAYVKILQDGNSNTIVSVYGVFLLRTDDYTPWLLAGNLNPSDYPTLDSLLADETAMGVLMNSSVAVDRMIRYTGTMMAGVINSETAMTALGLSPYVTRVMQNPDWAKFLVMSPHLSVWDEQSNTKKVPVMTSNTEPSGECSASGIYKNTKAYGAFDKQYYISGNDSSMVHRWACNMPDGTAWIQYKFEESIYFYKMYMEKRDSLGTFIKNGYLQYSEDGLDWNKAITIEANNEKVVESNPAFVCYGKYFRICITKINPPGENLISIDELQFYGKGGETND